MLDKWYKSNLKWALFWTLNNRWSPHLVCAAILFILVSVSQPCSVKVAQNLVKSRNFSPKCLKKINEYN